MADGKKKRQGTLGLKGEGVERKVLKDVNAAGEHYETLRDKRIAAGKKEKEAKNALIEVMKKHGETIYRDDDADPPILVVRSTKDDVKVSRIVDEDEGGGEEKAGEDLN